MFGFEGEFRGRWKPKVPQMPGAPGHADAVETHLIALRFLDTASSNQALRDFLGRSSFGIYLKRDVYKYVPGLLCEISLEQSGYGRNIL